MSKEIKWKSYKGGEYKVFRPNPKVFPNWYEYIVSMDTGLELYDGEFNSFKETYNGERLQQFEKKDAIKCAKALIDEVNLGQGLN